MTTQYNGMSVGEVFPAGMLDWYPQKLFRNEPVTKRLPERLSPAITFVAIEDSGRSWSGTQNIRVDFTEPMTADAAGWSATVNGVSKSVTYVSGSGTVSVVLQIASLIKHGDVVTVSYDQAAGGTISVSGSVEMTAMSQVIFDDQLTKRVRFILCDSADAVVANEAIATACLSSNLLTTWMERENRELTTTSGAGQVDILYTGASAVGGTTYAVVIRSVESLIVLATVV